MVALHSVLDFAVLINENGVADEDLEEVFMDPGLRIAYTSKPENKL